MKSLGSIFILLIIPFLSWSQDTVKRSIPLLNQSPKIESFISSLINLPENIKGSKNDSCILLSLNENSVKSFVVGLPASNHRKFIFDLGGNLEKSKSLGYFEFDGYLIFVFGDTFMDKFFTRSNFKREFTFIKPKVENNLSMVTNYMNWAVIYSNGELYYGVH